MSEIIKRLSFDKEFGILTKQALEIKLEKLDKFDSCFIDFNNLKKLNNLMGYNKVNKIIFNIFQDFKDYGCVVGRWFSGDEILIVGSDIKGKISILKDISYKNNMSFKEFYFIKNNFKTIGGKIGRLKQ